jgi:hypothetical protein
MIQAYAMGATTIPIGQQICAMTGNEQNGEISSLFWLELAALYIS